MEIKRNLVIFYDYYFPAYKAGGPVQSIINLSNVLAGTMNVHVICSAYEIDGSLLEGIETAQWNNVNGVQVYYLTHDQKNNKFLRQLIDDIKADAFFINGMFSPRFSIMPLLLWHRVYKGKVKLIVSPRGMLQKSALGQKPLKKALFIRLFKLLGLQKNINWHATDKQELQDLKAVFGAATTAVIIPNIPKRPAAEITPISKPANSLRLVFISLITEMKKLTFALQCLKDIDVEVTFDIYGPVKDPSYWQECQKEIELLPPNIIVRYLGDVKPTLVQQKFAEYHAFFLPTKGENFGHAIYESLSVGRPVIISNKTPWQDLEKNKAGFDIALDNKNKFIGAIMELYRMDADTYRLWCAGALKRASDFYFKHDFKEEYQELFK